MAYGNLYLLNQMIMTYSPKSIANYFIGKRISELSPMKLQKLVYFAHAWSLALFDKPLIDEAVEAWEFGPVVPSLYQEFKSFGNRPITRLANEYLEENESLVCQTVRPPGDPIVTALLDRIAATYGAFSPIQLSNMTHEPGSPWDIVAKSVREKNGGALIRNSDIDNDIIKEHFRAQTK